MAQPPFRYSIVILIQLQHLRFFLLAAGWLTALKISSADVLYCVLPLYHTSGGKLGVSCAITCGATVVVRRKFSASRFWDECVKHKATVCEILRNWVDKHNSICTNSSAYDSKFCPVFSKWHCKDHLKSQYNFLDRIFVTLFIVVIFSIIRYTNNTTYLPIL